jgi:cysteinyl-tRNA synthetase
MNDDFNSPLLIAHLFDVVKFINSVSNEKQQISSTDLEALKSSMHAFFFEVLGLTQPDANQISTDNTQLEGTLALLLEIRNKARVSKDFATSDLIRDALLKLNIQINDSPEGSSFKIN